MKRFEVFLVWVAIATICSAFWLLVAQPLSLVIVRLLEAIGVG